MFQSNERIVKHKLGVLNFVEELPTVLKACTVMGNWLFVRSGLD